MKLAVGQIRVAGGQVHENLQRAVSAIARAASAKADCIVLPEMMDVGWTHASVCEHAAAIPHGRSFEMIQEAAKAYNIHVVTGLSERSGGRVFNSAVVISPDAGLLLKHRKIYELDIAHGLYRLGDSLGVCESPFGRIGLMICADGFAPSQVISRSLCLMGAGFILSPCSWAVPSNHDNQMDPYGSLWEENYSPVARDFGIWIVGVSHVGRLEEGPWKGRKCIGNSMIIGPDGRRFFTAPYGEHAEDLTVHDLCPVERPARGDQWPGFWASHR